MVSLKLQNWSDLPLRCSLNCGVRKVWLDPNEVNEVSLANNRQNIRKLVKLRTGSWSGIEAPELKIDPLAGKSSIVVLWRLSGRGVTPGTQSFGVLTREARLPTTKVNCKFTFLWIEILEPFVNGMTDSWAFGNYCQGACDAYKTYMVGGS